jgi:hypothetical protein
MRALRAAGKGIEASGSSNYFKRPTWPQWSHPLTEGEPGVLR